MGFVLAFSRYLGRYENAAQHSTAQHQLGTADRITAPHHQPTMRPVARICMLLSAVRVCFASWQWLTKQKNHHRTRIYCDDHIRIVVPFDVVAWLSHLICIRLFSFLATAMCIQLRIWHRISASTINVLIRYGLLIICGTVQSPGKAALQSPPAQFISR